MPIKQPHLNTNARLFDYIYPWRTWDFDLVRGPVGNRFMFFIRFEDTIYDGYQAGITHSNQFPQGPMRWMQELGHVWI